MKKHYYLDDILKICTKKHFSAEDIFLLLRKKYPQIAQWSVYRNLDKLVEERKLTQVKGIHNKILYERTLSPHIHFVYQKTGKVIDVPFDTATLSLPFPPWYTPDHIDIIVYGDKK